MKRSYLILLLAMLLLFVLVAVNFAMNKPTDQLVFEGETNDEVPNVSSVSDDYILWFSNQKATIYDISSGEREFLPDACDIPNPTFGSISQNWIALRVDCFFTDTLTSSDLAYLYNMETGSYISLSDFTDQDRLPNSASIVTNGDYVLWLQRNEIETSSGSTTYTESEVYLMHLSSGEVSQPAFLGELVRLANVSYPWIVAQVYENNDRSGDILLSVYNLETEESYLVDNSPVPNHFILEEHHLVWTNLAGNDIYHHNLLTGETSLAVENIYDHQLSQSISRSILYFTVDPNIERAISELESERERPFNHTQIHSHNLVTGETKMIYENPDAEFIGFVLSYGDNLIWREDIEITASNSLHRVYRRNLTPFKLFFPLVDQ